METSFLHMEIFVQKYGIFQPWYGFSIEILVNSTPHKEIPPPTQGLLGYWFIFPWKKPFLGPLRPTASRSKKCDAYCWTDHEQAKLSISWARVECRFFFKSRAQEECRSLYSTISAKRTQKNFPKKSYCFAKCDFLFLE